MPEAIKKLIIDVGPKTADVTLSWENLYSYNKKIIDPISNRYFFVADPKKLKIRNISKTFHVKLLKHPQKPEKGTREYTITPEGENKTATFWIANKDANNAQTGKIFRLIELFNIKIQKTENSEIEAEFISESYEECRKAKAQLIHWVHQKDENPCKVTMPDANVIEGFAESTTKELKPNDIIQFERFGFVRIDQVTDVLSAYYAHK
jgi:glutamyl-tRNA synthetase